MYARKKDCWTTCDCYFIVTAANKIIVRVLISTVQWRDITAIYEYLVKLDICSYPLADNSFVKHNCKAIYFLQSNLIWTSRELLNETR